MRTLGIALVLYLVVMIGVAVAKPATVYDAKAQQYRPFGTGPGATLMPFWLLSLVVATGAYAAATVGTQVATGMAAMVPVFGTASAGAATASDPRQRPSVPDANYEYRRDPEPRVEAYPPHSPFASMYDRLRHYGGYQVAEDDPYSERPPEYPYDNGYDNGYPQRYGQGLVTERPTVERLVERGEDRGRSRTYAYGGTPNGGPRHRESGHERPREARVGERVWRRR